VPTIHDVARVAGVSSATVSHVINNSRVVAPATRQRVLDAIEALHYRRDGIARSLRRSSTGTIGLMVSDISNPFFSDLVRGVEDRIYGLDRGYNLILCNTDENPAKEKLYLDVLLEKRVDGLILAPAGGNAAYIRSLLGNGFPLVFVDRGLPALAADAVLLENSGAAHDMTAHLLRLGHRRIVAFQARLRANSIDERVAGWREALAEAGLAATADMVVTSESDIDCACAAALSMLQSGSRPDAVFCTNNFMTLGMLRALHRSGLRCPEDMAVAGFDDFPWADDFSPRLTVVAQPAYAMGEEAVRLLLMRLQHGQELPPARTLLQGRLIVRESCGAGLRRAGGPRAAAGV
jgi:LacI family transcriptional regulator